MPGAGDPGMRKIVLFSENSQCSGTDKETKIIIVS